MKQALISGDVPCSCTEATHAQHAHSVKHAGFRKPVANSPFVATLLHWSSSLKAA